ncbi:MAG: macrocin O-methyltransferase [Halothiobacillaceae bacterium]|nr:macrocin O-methyltransferase [Halothiobacillaceae bacterium]
MTSNVTQKPAQLTVAQAFQQAVAHHQAGRWQDAERLYRSILQSHPSHPDANFNLGVLAIKIGKAEMGLPHIDTAIKAAPERSEFWIMYSRALLAAGRPNDARATLEIGMQQCELPAEDVCTQVAAISQALQMRAAFPARPVPLPEVRDRDFDEILEKAWPLSMASAYGLVDAFYNLYQMVQYTVKHDIPGDYVECGVNAGGMSLLAALTFLKLGDTSRHLYLYDTFEGMPPPTSEDGEQAARTYQNQTQGGTAWAKVEMDAVRRTMIDSGYPEDKIHLVKGLVEDTIPAIAPDRISILRLDTDFYSSTRHELNHLYPRLSSGGALIIDDYGYYKGARLATDEYLSETHARILLHRLNFTVRVGIKV